MRSRLTADNRPSGCAEVGERVRWVWFILPLILLMQTAVAQPCWASTVFDPLLDFGQAVELDGVDDVVKLPNITLDSQLTIEMWIRVDEQSGRRTLITEGSEGSSAGNFNVRVEVDGNNISFDYEPVTHYDRHFQGGHRTQSSLSGCRPEGLAMREWPYSPGSRRRLLSVALRAGIQLFCGLSPYSESPLLAKVVSKTRLAYPDPLTQTKCRSATE